MAAYVSKEGGLILNCWQQFSWVQLMSEVLSSCREWELLGSPGALASTDQNAAIQPAWVQTNTSSQAVWPHLHFATVVLIRLSIRAYLLEVIGMWTELYCLLLDASSFAAKILDELLGNVMFIWHFWAYGSTVPVRAWDIMCMCTLKV